MSFASDEIDIDKLISFAQEHPLSAEQWKLLSSKWLLESIEASKRYAALVPTREQMQRHFVI